jgi:hypothetical protein
VSTVIAAIVVTVMMMNRGATPPPEKHEAARAATPPPPPADAAVAKTPPADAAEIRNLKFVTRPAHADIYKESEYIGPAPAEIPFVATHKSVEITAEAAGYEGHLDLDPLEYKDHQTIILKLSRIKGPPKMTRTKTTKHGAGSAAHAAPANTAGGELSGDPFKGSGTLPKR